MEEVPLSKEEKITLDVQRKRKRTTSKNKEPRESAVGKAIKELRQVSGLTLPATRPIFMGESSIRRENPLFTRYSTASKGMMRQMGFDLQTPIGLEDGASDLNRSLVVRILTSKVHEKK